MPSATFSLGAFFMASLVAFLSIIFFKNFNGVIEKVDLERCKTISIKTITGECLFRNDYLTARELFLKSSKDAGAEMMFLPVIGDLGTDVAILRGTSKRILIHISGTHGVEGYAGSAIQSAALMYLAQQGKMNDADSIEVNDLPTVIFIHALNPYGFANDRRVNENNVDLNRNFLSESEFASVQERDPNYAGYVDLNSLLNPVKMISTNIHVNEVYDILRTAYALGRYGLSFIRRALVSGNYNKKDGVGFGGFDLQQSAKNLIALIQDESLGLSDAEEVILLDVHTGLGPTGVDTLLFNKDSNLQQSFPTEMEMEMDTVTESSIPNPESSNIENEKKSRDFIKKSVIAGGIHAKLGGAETNVLAGYDLTVGQITIAFCDNWLSKNISKDKVTCILQEFGTVKPVDVGRYMIAENYAHYHGSEEEKSHYRGKYRDCFYVQSSFWKRRVVRRGLKVFIQSLQFLGANLEKFPVINCQL